MIFKAEKQIRKEIDDICKRWGLENHSFGFSTKGQVFTMGKANQAFMDHLAIVYLGHQLRNIKSEKIK